jgi:hypothetical protein
MRVASISKKTSTGSVPDLKAVFSLKYRHAGRGLVADVPAIRSRSLPRHPSIAV